MKAKDFALLLIGLLFGVGIGLTVFFGGRTSNGNSQLIQSSAPTVGEVAPDFFLSLLDGTQRHLSDYRGKPVLVNFWATWCAPCREEMPLIQSKYKETQKDLVVLGVNFDEPADMVKKFASDLNLTFPILLDPGGKISAVYHVNGYPTTFFIDADGIIRAEHIGSLSRSQLNSYLQMIELSR